MTKESNLKIVVLSALVTLNMWAGDQVIGGAIELGRKATAPVVIPAAKAYVDCRYPVAQIPDSNTKYEVR